ncbi:MAG: dipeptidase [Anaerolineales bacterium]
MRLIIDAHEDLAWNILTFNRDYTRSIKETRKAEEGSETPTLNGSTMVGWPEYQQAGVAIVYSTLFAAPFRRKLGDWDVQSYRDIKEAHRRYLDQLNTYHRLVDQKPDHFRLIQDAASLKNHLLEWQDEKQSHAVGFVILMEGAEGVQEPSELEFWWENGVRIIGPAWAGTRFCGGTREPGPLTDEGRALLDGMADIGFTLDLSHMDELAVRQALDDYPGAIIASHATCAALMPDFPNNRLLKDDIIKGIIERNGVIGMIPMLPFLKEGWKSADGRQGLNMDPLLIDQVDHICQLAGDSNHVGLGTDFDGGFGMESAPADLDSIGDLVKIPALLEKRGYSDTDMDAIMGKNWERHLMETLPG